MSSLVTRADRSITVHQERQRLWLRLFSCSATVEKRIRTKLKEEFNTTLPRFGIMAALAREPAGMAMSDLAAAVRISNAAVTGLVGGLCAEGLATRENGPDDGRVLVAKLTARGREVFVRIARVHAQWVEQTLAGLTDAQVEDLLTLLASVKDSIRENRI